MMNVKLFNGWDLVAIEEDMNEFLKSYDKEDILSVDVKTTLVKIELQDRDDIKFYYTGVVSYDEPRL